MMKNLSLFCVFLALSTVQGQMISDLLQIAILDLSNEIKALRGEIKESQENVKDMLQVYATKEDIKEALNSSLAACGIGDKKDKFDIERICNASKVAYIRDLGYVSLWKDKKNWEDARDFCLASGGRLIEGIQRKHFQPLLDLVGGDDFSDIAFVGIYNETWLSSGENVNLDLYHNKDPSRGKDVCGHFHFKKDCHGLGDFECVKERHYLCQYFA